MSTRPKRSSLKQKDTSVDMLGLSRQEERMLQRAMYDSLRQQSHKGLIKHQLLKSRDNPITTRSKSLTKLLISVPDSMKSTVNNNVSASCSVSTTIKPSAEEQKLKRGTRYSPMRKLPLSEMLKSLEDKKNQLNNDRSYSNSSYKVPTMTATKRKSSVKQELSLLKHPKLMNVNMVPRKPGRPKIIKRESTELLSSQDMVMTSTKLSGQLQMNSKPKRVPRTASLVARSSWMSKNSSASSPNRASIKMSPLPSSNSGNDKMKIKLLKLKSEKQLRKPKKLIYSPKALSHSQRISRVILANATQRCKKARIREKNIEKSQRLKSKLKSAKPPPDSKNKEIIPPELWLDPRGQPVDTDDFINFLIYRDTPYLDKSLKWFGLPPHKRKQRLYKIIPSETSKFNETVVYNERKEGGGREIIVHCQPPKMNDDTSELVSLDSDQVVVYTSLLEDSRAKCPASVNSSCITQAAVDEGISPNRKVNGDDIVKINENLNNKKRSIKIGKPLPKSDSKSTHIMEIRKRKS